MSEPRGEAKKHEPQSMTTAQDHSKPGDLFSNLENLRNLPQKTQDEILSVNRFIVEKGESRKDDQSKFRQKYQMIALWATIVFVGMALLSSIVLLFRGQKVEAVIAFILFLIIALGVNVFYRNNINIKFLFTGKEKSIEIHNNQRDEEHLKEE